MCGRFLKLPGSTRFSSFSRMLTRHWLRPEELLHRYKSYIGVLVPKLKFGNEARVESGEAEGGTRSPLARRSQTKEASALANSAPRLGGASDLPSSSERPIHLH